MDTSLSVAALFFKNFGDTLMGSCATHVDDTIHAGNEDNETEIRKLENNFECNPREYQDIQFSDVHIERMENSYIIHQKGYIAKLSKLSEVRTWEDFRSARAKLSWIGQTRPYIAFNVAILAQVTEERFRRDSKTFNTKIMNLIKYVKETSDFCLKFPKLDK